MSLPTLVRIDSGEKILLDRPVMMIGRSRSRADYQIDDPSVSSVHCELQSSAGGLRVKDLSQQGTLVNGRRIKSTNLKEGDILELVDYRFHVTFSSDAMDEPEAPTSAESSELWLVQLAGMQLGPMPWDELVGMAQRGELQEQDFLRAVSQSDWQQVGTLKQLFRVPQTEEPHHSTQRQNSAAKIQQAAASSSTETRIDDARTANSSNETSRPAPAKRTAEPPAASQSKLDPPKTTSSPNESSETVTDFLETPKKEAAALTDQAAGNNPREPLAETIVPTPAQALPEPVTISEQEKGSQSPNVSELPQDGWHYRHGTSRFGPIDLDEVQDLIKAGLLQPKDEVKVPGFRRWIPAWNVPGLFPDNDSPQSNAKSKSDSGGMLEDLPLPETSISMGNRLFAPFAVLIGLVTAGRRTGAVAASVFALIVWLIFPTGGEHEAYVSGQIKLDGKPLHNATITFTATKTGWGATSILDQEGRFEIATLRGGLLPGSYLISLMPSEPEPDDIVQALQKQFRTEIGRTAEDHPNIEMEQTLDDGDNSADEEQIELPAGTIPIRYRSLETTDLKATLVGGDNDVSLNVPSRSRNASRNSSRAVENHSRDE